MHFVRYGTAAAAVAYAGLQILGRRSGCTSRELRVRMPGDDLVSCPQMRTDHAITIGSLPQHIWPWLTQVGWHRGGWYTPSWVDRLFFPRNWPSPDHLDPALMRELRVGDTVPDGEPGTAEFVVALVDPPHALVLRSTSHLPPGWDKRFGAEIDWTWSFLLTPASDCTTRVHLRVRGRTSPWWLTGLYVATIIPADYVMGPGMLRGLALRVESGPSRRLDRG